MNTSTKARSSKNNGSVKTKKKPKKLTITEDDFMLANRRAARLEDISEHGRPTALRILRHESKKAYNRKRLKRVGEENC